MNSSGLQPLILNQLQNRLVSYGPTVYIQGDAVIVDTDNFSLTCTVFQQQEQPTGTRLLGLWFRLRLTQFPELEPLEDSGVGLRESWGECVEEAISSWIDGMLKAVTDAQNGAEEPIHLSTYNLDSKSKRTWKAYTGNLQVRGTQEEVDRIVKFWESSTWIEVLPSPIAQDFRELKPYWIKIVRSEVNNEITIDCNLNNQMWSYGYQAIAEFSLPAKVSPFRVVRWCIFCVPSGETPFTEDELSQFSNQAVQSKNKPWWKFW